MPAEAIVFDAYGTLFDVYGVEQACEEAFPGKGKEITLTWRQKQLEYTWLRSLMNRYVDFDQVTHDSLNYTLEKMGLDYTEPLLEQLVTLYLHLPVYAEVPEVLKALAPRKLAILSNGTADSLRKVVQYNQLTNRFNAILSADTLKVYKPDSTVYQMAVEQLGAATENILFVSSNGWDVAGAKSFGFHVTWVNRSGVPPEKLGAEANFVIKDLHGLVDVVNLHYQHTEEG